MNSTFDPLVGQVLDGRYEIVAKVARGGMATVYRARDLRLSRVVAVKVMRSDLGEDDEFAAKFDREARAAAVLSHPNVVSIFDQGTSQTQPYIVMEFIEGETLRRVISREAPLDPERALDMFEQIAAALAAAHEAGVVHRDIKPENVMITDRGKVKVADFGLARRVGSPQVTATGVLVGTASYLPPELVTHARPDGRSDVYSAGVVLFEMLTGKKPHTGENNYQIAYRHVNVDIEKPSQRLAEIGVATAHPIPDYLDALVLGMVARDTRARIPGGLEVLSAVRRARLELAMSGGRDKPELAAALLPDSPDDATEVTVTSRPRTSQRPRPEVSPRSPATVEVSLEPRWQPSGGTELSSTMVPPPAQSPVSPTVTATVLPRSQRTPVFALQVSHDPVHRRRRGILLVSLVLVLAVVLGFGSWWFAAGRFTTVPPMSSLNENTARSAAEANSLKISTDEAYSETVERGQVISTDPGSGEQVPKGSTVTVTLSLGKERYPMPDVLGRTLDDAKLALTDGKMQVGKVTEAYHEKVPAGEVSKASEETGAQLKKNTPVDLTVSKGPAPVRIPKVIGSPTAEAKKTLVDLGFKVTVTDENSTDQPKGSVLRQDPSSGNGKRGDTITLVNSLGPVLVEIPEVRMKSTADAKKALEDMDLKVKVQQDSQFPVPLNLASGTDPAAGTSVPVGSTVTLFVV